MTTIVLLATFAVDVLERQPVELPAFGADRQIARVATSAEYDEAKADQSFRYERLLYRSTGDVIVSGYLYAPRTPSGRQPAIVFSRGSMIVNRQAPVLLTMLRRLARAGFVVFAPMFRQSDGAEGRDEMGGADLDDLKNAIALVRALPQVDSANVFLYGESRGGIMTYLALRDAAPVRAAAVFGASTDFEETLRLTDPDGKIARAIWPDFASQKETILTTRSALRWPEKLRQPLLIMHGGSDTLPPPTQSLRLATALTELKLPYSLVIFANDNHGLTRNRLARDRLAVEWFLEHRSQ